MVEFNKNEQELLENEKAKRKETYDRSTNPINIKKLDALYRGPYKVIELKGVNTKTKVGNNEKAVHNNRLK